LNLAISGIIAPEHESQLKHTLILKKLPKSLDLVTLMYIQKKNNENRRRQEQYVGKMYLSKEEKF
jgi:ribosomal 50S subunit-associated protein YjgA (DUF615 family)